MEELDCVNKITVETSRCLKPCSGLLVSSFLKADVSEGDMDNLLPILDHYDNYKKITDYPSGESGKYYSSAILHLLQALIVNTLLQLLKASTLFIL